MAAIVWLRMLKILGNVNCIQDPSIYAEAMGGLQDIWNALYAVSYIITQGGWGLYKVGVVI